MTEVEILQYRLALALVTRLGILECTQHQVLPARVDEMYRVLGWLRLVLDNEEGGDDA